MEMILAILLFVVAFFAPQPGPSPALAGIAHVAFRVSDVQKSRAFYTSLGFEEAFKFTDPGKPEVSYIKINDTQFIELYGRASEAQPTGLLHVCYEATDLESLWKEYESRGLHVPESRKARAGNLLFAFRDPEGQSIEYTQYLPGSLHFEDRGKHLSGRRISRNLIGVTIPVPDPRALYAFYTSKLGFQGISSTHGMRMRLSGKSGEEIELEAATPQTKPRITFAVANLAHVAKALRSRSFALKISTESVSVTDPDGTVILFIAQRSERSAGNGPN